MERPVTKPANDRQRRFWLGLVVGLLWIIAGAAHANMPLNGAWHEVQPGDTPQSALRDYHNGQMQSFNPVLLQKFPRAKLGSWVVIAPQPPWDNQDRVLSILPPNTGSVTVYSGDQMQTLALNDFSEQLHGHGRLAWQVPEAQAASSPILLKFEPSSGLNFPVQFRMQRWDEYLRTDAEWLVFASACLAVMLAMVLMAVCFALMLHDITFAWYAGYVLCFALIQSIQSGFLFHPLRLEWLYESTGLVESTATALSVAFAALFMVRFCELPRYASLLRIPIVTLAIGMIMLVLMRCSQISLLVEVAQTLLNPLLMIGAALLLLAAFIAATRGSRPAWFFLAGWTPLIILTALTSAQDNGAFPQLQWLSDANLAGGAIEAVVLSLGLGDRALHLRHDRDTVRVLADHDALTNVLNRRAWAERASSIVASGPTRPVALLFMDLDHFKLLNDQRGHNAGDRALVAVAEALSHELRPSDLFGRYGGEEFVAMLDDTPVEHAMQVATRLCRRVHRLEIAAGSDASVLLSISIGVAMHVNGDDVETLAERADQAMYDAKLNGRNRAELFVAQAHPRSPRPRLRIIEKRRSDR